ncbi:MAG: DNA-3-methyladenine glycosylase [Acidimicrobiaceae bacterium]|nr:DNA-3-methyladenine glycosylase [Acidimicrobiaceae bacterium]
MEISREYDGRPRCNWCGVDELYVRYHDLEWGVPVHDDNTLFEYLTLEGAQAGLSWYTVLQRRDGYRQAFANFDPQAVAKYSDKKVERILQDPGVIRHRQKIMSAVTNAQAVLDAQREHGSFDEYLWSLGTLEGDEMVVAKSMSKQLARDGFKFVGPTICLSLMQAVGIVNDHARACFRFKEVARL